MYENLKNYFQRYMPLEEDLWFEIVEAVKIVQLKKGQFFLREGEVCDFVAYVNRGLVRLYYLEKDKEHIRQFLFEDTFVTEYASYVSRKPTLYNIDALEDTELFIFSYGKLNQLYDRNPQLLKFGKLMADRSAVHLANQLTASLRQKAEDRYLNLMKERPKVFQRVPLYMIASYLGITPEALSRIRRSIS
jgi:CRP/FNR family transcriptional regulator, anaerobic regulatory protein